MADKRISQLVDRGTIENNDVVPIVVSGATTTNKATISSIQTFMQENLDVGVTSVGITLGSAGTDVNVTGSPITTSGNITINIPDASATARGVVTTGTQTFGGVKTFADGLVLPSVGSPNQSSRFVNTGSIHQGSAGSNIFGFNNSNNIYFGKGLSNGGVIQWNNAAVRYYTLQDADGTLAFTSQLDGYVTLNTAQTITAQKVFNTSGSSDSVIITHGSGSGIALDVIKAGSGEAIRVTKTSGSGNAVTITGDASITGAFSVTNSTSTFAIMNSTNANGGVLTFRRNGTNVGHIGNSAQLGGGVLDAIEVRSGVGSSVILKTDGGQVTLATGGGVTLTGALNGTSGTFNNGIVSNGGAIGYGGGELGFGVTNSSASSAIYTLATGSPIVFFDHRAPGNTGSFVFRNGTGGANTLLTLASTGAATFSSSVTATSGVFTTGITLQGAAATSILNTYSVGGTIYGYNGVSGAANSIINGSVLGDLVIRSQNKSILFSTNGGSTSALTLSSTGAATFSGSVSAASLSGAFATLSNYGSATSTALQLGDANNGLFRPALNSVAIATNGSAALTLASTGAATFSGNVFISKASPLLVLNDTSGSGAQIGSFGGNLNLIDNATGTKGMVMSLSTGAATFSSSVTAAGMRSIDAANTWSFSTGSNSTTPNIVALGTISGTPSIQGFNFGFSTNQNLCLQPQAGSVGIGTASPSSIFDVRSANVPRITLVKNGIVSWFIGNPSQGTSNDFSIGTDSGGNTQILNITSGGNVGIGTASPSGKLEVNGQTNIINGAINFGGSGVAGSTDPAIYRIAGLNDMAFAIGSTERMRITSGGYLKVSNNGSYTYPTNSFFTVDQSVADWTQVNVNKVASGTPLGIFSGFSAQSPNNTSSLFFLGQDSTTDRFAVRSNGGIANYQANDVNLSDERTKKDIEPLESYWDKFKAIEIVKFKYKDQTHDDFNIGVIAQQVEAVAPEFVDVDGWDTKPKLDEEQNEIVSEEEPLKSIYTADLHHATIKVLQEAMAKIEELQIQIDSLKNQIK